MLLAGGCAVTPSVGDLHRYGVATLHPAGAVRVFGSAYAGHAGLEPAAASIDTRFVTRQPADAVAAYYDRVLRRRGWIRDDNAASELADATRQWAWTKQDVVVRVATLDRTALQLIEQARPRARGGTLAYEVVLGPRS